MARLNSFWRVVLAPLAALLLVAPGGVTAGTAPAHPHDQFLLVNLHASEFNRDVFQQIRQLQPTNSVSDINVGVSSIFSYFQHDRPNLARQLTNFLNLASEFSLPVIVQIDGEQWWGNRPDLWNWWDPDGRGFDPANRQNVEWTGWGPEHAIRISWRNWGQQLRVKPAPNLMSPRYRSACQDEMRYFVPLVLDWWRGLPPEKKELFVGIKLGWESAIGVNSYYYTNGNELLERPAAQDPKQPVNPDLLPGRGFVPIGYAAVSTLGLAKSGELREADLARVVKIHLEDLCRLVSELGVSRNRLFTHGGGWKKGELLYGSAVNRYSCPGWSFYTYAPDPRQDTTAMDVLKTSNAPYWAAAEWLGSGRTQQEWESGFRNTLSIEGCRYLCIFNWNGIHKRPEVLKAITGVATRAR